jgi:GNAT superfamily N-acetyltransferase
VIEQQRAPRARTGDTIVGFGFSWMSEKFWCLSQLFVRPETQAKGIGQALLSKTLMQAERNGAAHRALITFAYNIASTGLYLQNGLYPREPLYRMIAPAQGVAQNLGDAGYDARTLHKTLRAASAPGWSHAVGHRFVKELCPPEPSPMR